MDFGWNIGVFGVGLVILCIGAEVFLRGATGIARRFGISTFVIGLTIVGFGTSAPELAVNLSAALGGTTDVAIGNAVGSNISNIGLILGLSALVRPLNVQMQLLRFEVPIMIGTAFLLALLAYDGRLDWIDGGMMLALFLGVAYLIFRRARRESPAVKEEISHQAGKEMPLRWPLLYLAIGLAGLVGGAELMVRAAVELARAWGISELVIGLTIVAVGTSLPELASSMVAAYRGDADIAVGNVIGSNIFNILLILGTTSVAAPLPVSWKLFWIDLPIMIGFSLLLIPIMIRDLRITRSEGLVLLLAYIGFLVYQVVVPN